jgi:hypothetical protein
VLTLLFLPALYVAWFRIKEPETARTSDSRGVGSEGSRDQKQSLLWPKLTSSRGMVTDSRS